MKTSNSTMNMSSTPTSVNRIDKIISYPASYMVNLSAKS